MTCGECDQGRHVGAGVAAMAGILIQDTEPVAAIERRLTLPQFVFVDFEPFDADAGADAERNLLRLERRAIGVDIHQPFLLDKRPDAGFVGKRTMEGGGVGEERLQRPGRVGDALLRPTGGQIAKQPWCCPR